MILDETKILKVSPDLSGEGDLDKIAFAAEIIKKGGLVAFPTETVYGLGANALDEKAVASIFTAKGRAQDNPLIVHVADAKDINNYAFAEGNKKADILMSQMPAPLTVILPKKDIIPLAVTAGLENVALRVPENVIARKLIELSGLPVSAPSANLSGKPSPTKAWHVIADMNGRADVIIDGGDCAVGLESTVVTLCTETPKLLRPGGFTYEKLSSLLGKVEISDAVLKQLKEGQKPESPGMKYKHYAPDISVMLVKGSAQQVKDFLSEKYKNENCGIICFDEDMNEKSDRILSMGSRNMMGEYAEKMFDALRLTDTVEGIDTVYAVLPETTDGISLAIYNRMLRAAAFNIIEL